MNDDPSSQKRKPPLRIAIAGLGTVGTSVVQILTTMQEQLVDTAERPLEIVAVSARDKTRDRGVDLSNFDWCDDPVDLGSRNDVDIVIELIGGSDGPALALTQAALDAGKSVVTANKAMMAIHGADLAKRAEKNGACLRFEAAVAGGIPIIKALSEGLVANCVSKVAGILNGTCNYILTSMEADGSSFGDALEDAQHQGYAEADPGFDIGGMDTAHKTALLAAVAFGVTPPLEDMSIEGIEAVAPVDINYARDLGYRIKLLGVAEKYGDDIEARVAPTMVPVQSAIASVYGVTNAVEVVAEPVGTTVYEGPGAGGGATASAVVADVLDMALGHTRPAFGLPAHKLAPGHLQKNGHRSAFYLRLRVVDAPGVMAEVAKTLADMEMSIESLLQRGHAPDDGVYVVLTTHPCTQEQVRTAIERLKTSSSVLEEPTLIRIDG